MDDFIVDDDEDGAEIIRNIREQKLRAYEEQSFDSCDSEDAEEDLSDMEAGYESIEEEERYAAYCGEREDYEENKRIK